MSFGGRTCAQTVGVARLGCSRWAKWTVDWVGFAPDTAQVTRSDDEHDEQHVAIRGILLRTCPVEGGPSLPPNLSELLRGGGTVGGRIVAATAPTTTVDEYLVGGG